MPPDPTSSLAVGDPGDDTARRYHYQWTYAAITCCLLLDSTEDVVELFCEHHEDILLKHADGSFTGLQLKTRNSDQQIWSTSDDDLWKSFAKFVSLDRLFPGQFRRFAFLTNHPLQATKNGKDICHVLKAIKDAATIAGLPSTVLAFLEKVAKKAGCSEEVAFAAMKKCEASDDLPKREDVEARLVVTLTPLWDRADECSHASLRRAARGLIDECGRASSLAHEGLLPAYLPISSVPNRGQAEAISFKRFSRTDAGDSTGVHLRRPVRHCW
jgi:Cap4, dsDNA endonuclease domain